MSNATFYNEWLGVDKNQFRILALLAPTGIFKGTLTDMCRSLYISAQHRNREKLKDGISELTKNNYITSTQNGRTYTLTVIPKETVIEIPDEWLEQIMNHTYTSESVSWQAVLKVILWLTLNREPIVQRSYIATDLNVSVDTVGSALTVLQKDFGAITKEIITKQTHSGEYRRIGLEISQNAWWN